MFDCHFSKFVGGKLFHRNLFDNVIQEAHRVAVSDQLLYCLMPIIKQQNRPKCC